MKKLNRKIKVLIVILCTITALSLGLVLFITSPAFKVKLAVTESHLEIGSRAEKDPAFYLKGKAWSIPFSHVDTSSVKYKQVGRYPVYIYHGFKKYTSYVNVTDTTAPTISCDVKNKTISVGETISVNSLGLKIDDYSDIENVEFTKISSSNFYTGLPDEETVEMKEAYRKGIKMNAEEFQFSYGGRYLLTISATDAFYNTSEIELALTVEDAPVLNVPDDFYVADTVELDFTEYIEVWDFITTELDAKDVEVNTDELYLTKVGTYPVTFSVTDEYGLSTEKTANVHVSSQDALQELLNTHKVDFTKSVIIGAKNAYDSGYYASENIGFIQNIMLPSIVYIKNDALDSFGSGFIIEITDEFVTLVTNEHVIHSDLTVDVSFYDATSCSGAVVASSPERDIAFIRIPIEGKNNSTSLSSEYVRKLRTVHIDKGYWDSLSDDCNITIGYNCINSEGKIWKTDTGRIVEKEAIRDWNQYKNVNETIISMKPVAGTSGSALFDGYGRLVGMMRGYTEYENYSETVAVPLSEILSYFEIVFKYKIHYQ